MQALVNWPIQMPAVQIAHLNLASGEISVPTLVDGLRGGGVAGEFCGVAGFHARYRVAHIAPYLQWESTASVQPSAWVLGRSRCIDHRRYFFGPNER